MAQSCAVSDRRIVEDGRSMESRVELMAWRIAAVLLLHLERTWSRRALLSLAWWRGRWPARDQQVAVNETSPVWGC